MESDLRTQVWMNTSTSVGRRWELEDTVSRSIYLGMYTGYSGYAGWMRIIITAGKLSVQVSDRFVSTSLRLCRVMKLIVLQITC